MRHTVAASLYTLVLFGLLAIPTGNDAATAEGCTVRDRVNLAAAGYSRHEIERLYGTGWEPFDSSQPSSILNGQGQPGCVQSCRAPHGQSPVDPVTSGSLPPGSPCHLLSAGGYV